MHSIHPLINDQASDVIIFGSGACAQKTAANLAEQGINVCVASTSQTVSDGMSGDTINWLTDTQLIECKGFAGDFNLVLNQGNVVIHKSAGAIVVAEDHMVSPNYTPYGLTPHKCILDISFLEEKLRLDAPKVLFQEGAGIAFLCGWQIDSHPGIARRMLDRCLQLQETPSISTMFMAGNLKVSSNGAEAVYLQAKRAGTVFLKFTQAFPGIHLTSDGRFDIEYQDELTRTPFRTNADWIVVDETITPGRGLEAIAKTLEIEKDDDGFAQRDNLHRLSNATNRRGIFVAGGTRGILSREEQKVDADQVTLKVLAFLRNKEDEPLPKVEIHRGRCARCLTCHRLCPHKAIDIGQRISVVTHACQSCGICMAGCPARAIDMEEMNISADLKTWDQQAYSNGDRSEKIPCVVVFGCTRSAGKAHELTRMMGYVMPPGVRFIEVPCGGTISSRHLLAAFDNGAQGVMLCTCHTDNCKSDVGNKLAGKRAESVRTLLDSVGIENSRLNVSSFAANMGNEFYLKVNEFVDRIRSLNSDTPN